MSIVEATSNENFIELIKNDNCMIDFYGEWCSPCEKLMKNLDKINQEHPNVTIIKVNCNDLDAVAEKYQVTQIPHIAFYKDGKLHGEYMVTSDHNEIIDKMKEIFQSDKKGAKKAKGKSKSK